MKIKKFIVIFVSITLILSFTACSKTPNLVQSVSRLRADTYFGENENYTLTIYPEVREHPLIADGKINQTKKVLIVKLKVKNNLSGEFKITLTLDKEYAETFNFSAIADCFITSIDVEKLPDKPFIATICHNESMENVNMESLLKPSTISADKALNLAYKHKKEYVDNLMINGVFEGEIYLRLICEIDKNYWYVGFITEKNTLCLLIGENGVIDERTIPNPV